MLSKTPKLMIKDEQTFDRLRIRYYDKETKKIICKQISYGRTISKEEAYAKMEQFRSNLLIILAKQYEELRQKKCKLEEPCG